MANTRLFRENTRFDLAFPQNFTTWTTPTTTQLNNSGGGLIFNLSTALSEAGTTFTLGDSDTDDSLTFTQSASAQSPTFYNPEVVYEVERSSDATATNVANTAFGLLFKKGITYFAIMRIGKAADAAYAVGDRVSLVGVKTDNPVETMGSGENIRLTQSFLRTGDVLWQYKLLA